MNFIKPDVSTLCIGLKQAWGPFADRGCQGQTLHAPEFKVMIHQPLGGMQGQATEIEIHAAKSSRRASSTNNILAERTGRPLEKIERDTERDYFLTADEAKDYGLVDQVINKRG